MKHKHQSDKPWTQRKWSKAYSNPLLIHHNSDSKSWRFSCSHNVANKCWKNIMPDNHPSKKMSCNINPTPPLLFLFLYLFLLLGKSSRQQFPVSIIMYLVIQLTDICQPPVSFSDATSALSASFRFRLLTGEWKKRNPGRPVFKKSDYTLMRYWPVAAAAVAAAAPVAVWGRPLPGRGPLPGSSSSAGPAASWAPPPSHPG